MIEMKAHGRYDLQVKLWDGAMNVEGGPNPGHFDAAGSGFEHRRSKGQKAAMQLYNRDLWRFTNQASDRRGGLVLLRPVAWIWTALYKATREIYRAEGWLVN